MKRPGNPVKLRVYGHEDFPFAAVAVARFEDRPPRKARARKQPPKTPVRQILSPTRATPRVGLVVTALLAVLGVWFGSAGPVGEWMTWLLRASFGAAIAFPIIGLYWGIVLLRDIAREDRVRMCIGFLVLSLGILGMLSLFGGNPRPTDGYESLSGAGGFFGALVASLLEAGHLLARRGDRVPGVGRARAARVLRRPPCR